MQYFIKLTYLFKFIFEILDAQIQNYYAIFIQIL